MMAIMPNSRLRVAHNAVADLCFMVRFSGRAPFYYEVDDATVVAAYSLVRARGADKKFAVVSYKIVYWSSQLLGS
jgi:hypothetical protein